MTRRKSKSVLPIGTREEAASIANDYAQLTAEIAGIEAERLRAKAEIDRDCDERLGDRNDRQAAMFERLKLWWEGGAAAAIAGKKRSTVFGGVKIGLRTPTPSLKWAKGNKGEDMIKAIRALRWLRVNDFVRTKPSLDKEAIIKAMTVGDDPAKKTLVRIGFEISQVEEFFIDVPARTDAPEGSTAI